MKKLRGYDRRHDEFPCRGAGVLRVKHQGEMRSMMQEFKEFAMKAT
ncbi:hypothetical protein [Candidatus Accumulibacter sp. ACC012]|nr:hypothetical protein [Candidatus Accumulibacter sp. ACC012]